ncbi:glycosyltransferase family 4 protein [Candidatus Cetobacterium colombiensis]|jgi:glycosyltransferase involved in cell wall biosynthesis|uniref:Glycosyltransferase family 4 protein n=1 Tax=Candidatus Cetobacterium colombiensis TaxID=3073100 RepID=A0ABU4WER1_9FUSO|nr:glycosyltransferase family 4 protein [Candidatus Cetobacterium colombiensis]MDX8337056.1 glycosyltransferase family 4 protein [Candidatus Cetobacterium colombiensis]
MKKLKIFFTANVLWDIYIFRYGVIKALIEDGHEVVAVAPIDSRINFPEELGIRHIPIELSLRGVNPVKDFKLFLELKKIYKKEKPDIIFHYTIKPNIYGTLAAKCQKISSVAVLTGLGYSFVEGGVVSAIAKTLYKISLNYAKEVWVLNEDDKKRLIDEKIVKENKLFILPGEGVDTKKFSPIPKEKNETITFLMVARAFYDKGVREYVEAAKIIKSKGYKVKFWFLGALGGSAANGIDEAKMKEYTDSGILEYLGHRKDVEAVINASDCVILPSYREGISKVLMEAASMEKPIIATNVTGCKEIVDNNKNGYLVESKNSIDLSEKIEKFINLSYEEKVLMGKNGRKKILNEFDEKIIIDIYRRKLWNLHL